MKIHSAPKIEKLLLNDITIAYFYSFNFEGQINIKDVRNSRCFKDNVKAYTLDKEIKINTKGNDNIKIRELIKFEDSYYFPDYPYIEKPNYIEFENIQLSFKGQSIEVNIIVSLHKYNVGTVVFILDSINSIDSNALKNLIFLDEIKYMYSLSYIPVKFISGIDPTDRICNLTEIFWGFLSWLEKELQIKKKSRLKSFQIKTFKVTRKECNIYVANFISDIINNSKTLDEFIKANKKQIFDLITIRCHYMDRDFYSSRSDNYIESVLKKRLGNRRYISYYLTESRMTAFSLAKRHKNLYPYGFEWYVAYISMLNMMRLQFELLNKLYKLLYVQELKGDPLKLVDLNRIIIYGLEEYENIRFPINERSREFIQQCKEVMNLKDYVEIIEKKLTILSKSTTEYFNRILQAKNDAITYALYLLTIILLVPVVIEIIDKLFYSPPFYYYLLTWLGVAIFFYIIQKILYQVKIRRLHK